MATNEIVGAQGMTNLDLAKIYQKKFERNGELSQEDLSMLHNIGRSADHENDKMTLAVVTMLEQAAKNN